MSASGPYVCTLDAATQKKAEDELMEDPKNRQGSIDTLRKWIQEQKHLACPADDVFLLSFLRARKFSQLESRDLLENFLKKRAKLSAWYKDLDCGTPKFLKKLDAGGVLILPKRDAEGRRVFIVRPGYTHTYDKEFDKDEAFRMFATIMDYMYIYEEETQVHGTVTIVDMTLSKLAHENKVPISDRKRMMSVWQNSYPARIKAFHLFNPGVLMEIMMAFVKLAMTERIQKRLTVHGSNLESLYKHVPKEILPDEYLEDDYTGPSGGSEKSIIENMKAEFSKPEVREKIKFYSSNKFWINMKEKDTDVPVGSFRQLSTD